VVPHTGDIPRRAEGNQSPFDFVFSPPGHRAPTFAAITWQSSHGVLTTHAIDDTSHRGAPRWTKKQFVSLQEL
jgi:hypothetical protein